MKIYPDNRESEVIAKPYFMLIPLKLGDKLLLFENAE